MTSQKLSRTTTTAIACAVFSIFSSITAFAEFREVNVTNLKDFSFSEKSTRRCSDFWTTMIKVDNQKFFRTGCGGSATHDTMIESLEKVARSPIQQECIKEKRCYGRRCDYVMGLRTVNYKIRMLVEGNKVERFFEIPRFSRCE